VVSHSATNGRWYATASYSSGGVNSPAIDFKVITVKSGRKIKIVNNDGKDGFDMFIFVEEYLSEIMRIIKKIK